MNECGIAGPFQNLHPVSGGCISQAFTVATAQGQVFVKTGGNAPDQFLREWEGLETLARAETSLRIPKVLGCCSAEKGPAALVLEYLAPGPKNWETFGRGLAELHRRAENRFGFANDNYLGSTPQENGWIEDWGQFFALRRIGAMVKRLQAAGDLSDSDAAIYTRLLEKIPALLSHRPRASLLHGDLWNGNFLAAAHGPALVDPAVYFGDREAEWAMMRLFGGFPESVLAAYQEVFPLPKEWKERQPLYQLYHLLNHQLLFGGGYGARALGAAKRYL